MSIPETAMHIGEVVIVAIRFKIEISHRIVILGGLNTVYETLCLTLSPNGHSIERCMCALQQFFPNQFHNGYNEMIRDPLR